MEDQYYILSVLLRKSCVFNVIRLQAMNEMCTEDIQESHLSADEVGIFVIKLGMILGIALLACNKVTDLLAMVFRDFLKNNWFQRSILCVALECTNN